MSDRKPIEELKTRSNKVFNNKYCKQLVRIAQTRTPSSAYDETYVLTGDARTAKACRFLAMIKRDYGFKAFKSFVSSKTNSPRLTDTDKSKGIKPMSTKSKQKVKTKKAKVKTEKTNKQVSDKPSLPLKHVSYRASVNGAFSRVKCIQEFGNDAQNPVEAFYVFPMPDESTVIACTMLIGKKKVEAELKGKIEARKEHEAALDAGNYSALLEQERPNIFTMSVGGIEPGEKISVEVDYVQRIPWQAGGGRFTIPLVVAPRFIPGIPSQEEHDRGFSPDTDAVSDAHRITPKVAKEGVSYNADISVLFSPGFRCELSCPSHSSIIAGMTVAKNDSEEIKTGNILTDRDFTLVYKSLSKVPEVAIHAGKFKDENFMLANIFPPGNVKAVESDVVMVLDCSGSMSFENSGAKMHGMKIIAKKIAKNLKKQSSKNRVGIVPFDNAPWPEHPISEINEATNSFIDRLNGRGGTCLGYGLEKAKQMIIQSRRPGVILMITDGDTEHAKGWYGDGIRLIGIGIGTAVNDTKIKDLTRHNYGVAEFVYPGEDYDAVANRLAGYLSGPVLRDVEVETDGEVVGINDVFEGLPASIVVRFAKTGKVGLTITGKNPQGQEVSWKVSPSDAKECDFLAQIWAREFIRENQDEKKQTQTSLQYGVICKHTSFVAVSLKEVPGQKPERVEIPVNLPAGWDYEAVFGAKGIGIPMAPGAKRLFRGGVGGAMRSFAPTLDDLSVGSYAGPIGDSIDEVDELCSIDALGPDDEDILTGPQIPTPIIPPTPPTPVVSSRFTLDAKDVVDRMFGILTALFQGKRDDAEKAFKKLQKELTPAVAAKLDPEKKAMAYYLSLRLATYGLSIDSKVIAKLRVEPKSGNAVSWFNLAKKEMGRPYNSVIPSGEAAEFVSWKFGKGEKPSVGDWALVC